MPVVVPKFAITLAVAALATIVVFTVLHHKNTDKSVEAVEINPTALYDAFSHYKNKHNLKWGKSESDMRFGVFTENFKVIAEHNAKPNTSYQLGITSLAHLTREEFASLKLGYQGYKKVKATNGVHVEVDPVAEVDWVEKGAVTPIKDQGQCGSCWAFSTTGSLEGLNFVENGKLISLSEQQLVDCAGGEYGNQGCNGGLMDYGFKYAAAEGLTTEEAYPYTATDGDCKDKIEAVFKNNAFTDVAADNDTALIAAITKQPVSVAIEADTQAFQFYESGIITDEACGTTLDHGVLAVGFGSNFIKVKNSWGEAWGVKGYVLIGRKDGAGICGINSAASYPTL